MEASRNNVQVLRKIFFFREVSWKMLYFRLFSRLRFHIPVRMSQVYASNKEVEDNGKDILIPLTWSLFHFIFSFDIRQDNFSFFFMKVLYRQDNDKYCAIVCPQQCKIIWLNRIIFLSREFSWKCTTSKYFLIKLGYGKFKRPVTRFKSVA